MQIYIHMCTAALFGMTFVGFHVAGWLGWSFSGVIVFFIAADILFLAIMHCYHRYRNPWYLRYIRAMHRLTQGDEAEQVALIAELEAQHAAGKRPLETALMLAAAYCYTGRGDDAEPMSDEVISGVIARKLCEKRDLSARIWCEYARLARFDAWSTQGRFAEAAHSLRPGASGALRPEFMICVIAWGFFLARDDYNAQIVLEQLKLPKRLRHQKAKIPPKYLFMLAFMHWRLLGEETRADLHALRSSFAEWEKSAARHAGDLYGARVGEILAEIRPLLVTPDTGGGLG